MITVFHAIQSLVPGAEVSVGIYDQTIVWHRPETAPVTLEQILQEQQRLQQAYDWNEYQRNRAREYPTIQEQLDALYHAGVFPPEMAARIRAVKAKYPRYSPEQAQTAEQTTPTMSVEQWLASQTTPTVTVSTAMTVEEWLKQQVEQETPQKLTREQWLEQQKTVVAPPQMTREQWLAEQAKIK